MTTPHDIRLGIAAIATHQPGWKLDNGWFGDVMPRKFAHHTGIESRAVSLDDEVSMGVQAVRRLQQATGCSLADCRGLVFVGPSFIPAGIARRHLDGSGILHERTSRAAREVALVLGMPRCRTVGINWFCCGYSRALALVQRRWAPRLRLHGNDFLLVVVGERISRITDYGAGQTAGLFGDMASATLVAPLASRRYPSHFELVYAKAERQPADRPSFDFHLKDDVPVPLPDGGRGSDRQRIVFWLDGMAIAEAAPRAMSAAVEKALAETGIAGRDVDFVVPHQAGTGIVRFTGMKLEEQGIRAELVNGLTQHTGNVSACSVPHALSETWGRLRGLVACPTAAVGSPGRAEMLRGCVLLRSTPLHDRVHSAVAVAG